MHFLCTVRIQVNGLILPKINVILSLTQTPNAGPWSESECMDIRFRCRDAVAEIYSASAAVRWHRVGWLSTLIQPPALHPAAASWYIPPALSLFIELLWFTVCFISASRRPFWGFAGARSALLFVPIFLGLSALFLLGFSWSFGKLSMSFPEACFLSFSCSSYCCLGSGLRVGTSWL